MAPLLRCHGVLDVMVFLDVVPIIGVFSSQEEEQLLTIEDYVGMIQDSLVMGKNICIMRQ